MHSVASTVPARSPCPVVLVHGVGLSHRYLLPLAVHMARDFRLHIPDLPGFGLSFKPDRVLTIPETVDWLAAWVEAVGLERPAFLGNSVGCQYIIDLAVRYPNHISRAVLQGPTCDPEAATFPRQFWRWLLNRQREELSNEPVPVRFPGNGSPPRIEPVSPIGNRDYRECGATRLIQTFRYAMDDPLRDKLPRMACPTLVVRGATDPIVPQRWAEEIVSLLPHGQLIVLPGVPHTANLEAPLELSRVVKPFLAEEAAHRDSDARGRVRSARRG